jgi:hypothetical protein
MSYSHLNMELNSKNKTILVVSDMHQEVDKMERILQRENYDICVMLGDEFDSFYFNSEQDVIKTCNFIKKYIFKDNFFFILGNHTIQYLYGNPNTICSGYEKWKDRLITREFGSFMPAIREKFLWYIFVDDRFCSHAGLHPCWLPPNITVNKDNITKWLNDEISFAEPALINNERHWTFNAGRGRGGYQKVGGLTWLDWREEFQPIDGLSQIVGHSSHNYILPYHTEGSLDCNDWENIDIDCHLNSYLIIQNQKIQIRHYKDL